MSYITFSRVSASAFAFVALWMVQQGAVDAATLARTQVSTQGDSSRKKSEGDSKDKAMDAFRSFYGEGKGLGQKIFKEDVDNQKAGFNMMKDLLSDEAFKDRASLKARFEEFSTSKKKAYEGFKKELNNLLKQKNNFNLMTQSLNVGEDKNFLEKLGEDVKAWLERSRILLGQEKERSLEALMMPMADMRAYGASLVSDTKISQQSQEKMETQRAKNQKVREDSRILMEGYFQNFHEKFGHVVENFQTSFKDFEKSFEKAKSDVNKYQSDNRTYTAYSQAQLSLNKIIDEKEPSISDIVSLLKNYAFINTQIGMFHLNKLKVKSADNVKKTLLDVIAQKKDLLENFAQKSGETLKSFIGTAFSDTDDVQSKKRFKEAAEQELAIIQDGLQKDLKNWGNIESALNTIEMMEQSSGKEFEKNNLKNELEEKIRPLVKRATEALQKSRIESSTFVFYEIALQNPSIIYDTLQAARAMVRFELEESIKNGSKYTWGNMRECIERVVNRKLSLLDQSMIDGCSKKIKENNTIYNKKYHEFRDALIATEKFKDVIRDLEKQEVKDRGRYDSKNALNGVSELLSEPSFYLSQDDMEDIMRRRDVGTINEKLGAIDKAKLAAYMDKCLEPLQSLNTAEYDGKLSFDVARASKNVSERVGLPKGEVSTAALEIETGDDKTNDFSESDSDHEIASAYVSGTSLNTKIIQARDLKSEEPSPEDVAKFSKLLSNTNNPFYKSNVPLTESDRLTLEQILLKNGYGAFEKNKGARNAILKDEGLSACALAGVRGKIPPELMRKAEYVIDRCKETEYESASNFLAAILVSSYHLGDTNLDKYIDEVASIVWSVFEKDSKRGLTHYFNEVKGKVYFPKNIRDEIIKKICDKNFNTIFKKKDNMRSAARSVLLLNSSDEQIRRLLDNQKMRASVASSVKETEWILLNPNVHFENLEGLIQESKQKGTFTKVLNSLSIEERSEIARRILARLSSEQGMSMEKKEWMFKTSIEFHEDPGRENSGGMSKMLNGFMKNDTIRDLIKTARVKIPGYIKKFFEADTPTPNNGTQTHTPTASVDQQQASPNVFLEMGKKIFSVGSSPTKDVPIAKMTDDKILIRNKINKDLFNALFIPISAEEARKENGTSLTLAGITLQNLGDKELFDSIMERMREKTRIFYGLEAMLNGKKSTGKDSTYNPFGYNENKPLVKNLFKGLAPYMWSNLQFAGDETSMERGIASMMEKKISATEVLETLIACEDARIQKKSADNGSFMDVILDFFLKNSDYFCDKDKDKEGIKKLCKLGIFNDDFRSVVRTSSDSNFKDKCDRVISRLREKVTQGAQKEGDFGIGLVTSIVENVGMEQNFTRDILTSFFEKALSKDSKSSDKARANVTRMMLSHGFNARNHGQGAEDPLVVEMNKCLELAGQGHSEMRKVILGAEDWKTVEQLLPAASGDHYLLEEVKGSISRIGISQNTEQLRDNMLTQVLKHGEKGVVSGDKWKNINNAIETCDALRYGGTRTMILEELKSMSYGDSKSTLNLMLTQKSGKDSFYDPSVMVEIRKRCEKNSEFRKEVVSVLASADNLEIINGLSKGVLDVILSNNESVDYFLNARDKNNGKFDKMIDKEILDSINFQNLRKSEKFRLAKFLLSRFEYDDKVIEKVANHVTKAEGFWGTNWGSGDKDRLAFWKDVMNQDKNFEQHKELYREGLKTFGKEGEALLNERDQKKD